MIALAVAAWSPRAIEAQGDGGYRLVPNWPKLPAGMYLRPEGRRLRRRPNARRRPRLAARAVSTDRRRGRRASRRTADQPGISGLAIDQHDRIYAFNRGPKPVMVFDRDGNLVMSGADQEINGKTINPSWQHSGTVDWEGNVYIIERDAHRIVKLESEAGQVPAAARDDQRARQRRDALRSAVGHRRAARTATSSSPTATATTASSCSRRTASSSSRSARAPADRRTRAPANGEWVLPHKLAVDADENLYIIDRENHRVQVFDKNLTYIRQFANEGWNPWDIGISRKGNEGLAFIADHALERVHKISLKDGKILATWGKQGRGPGEFDWVHGIVVDSQRRGVRRGHVRPATAEVRAPPTSRYATCVSPVET